MRETDISVLSSRISRIKQAVLCLFVCFFVMISSQNAFAYRQNIVDYECADGKSPPVIPSTPTAAINNCKLGACGACVPKNNYWNDPKIEVIYEHSGVEKIRTFTLGPNQCEGYSTNRFCARIVYPGPRYDDNGMKIDGSKEDNYGNITAENGLGKPQLCAYEDPTDGMDTEYNYNPYHEGATNPNALDVADSAATGALIGGAAGLSGGPLVMFTVGAGAAAGALIGTATGLISQTYNHIVSTNIGCIDLKISEIPPAFSNDAWHNQKFYPFPTIQLDKDSTFESTKVNVYICKKNGELVRCRRDEDGEIVNGNGDLDFKIADEKTLTLTALSFSDSFTADDGREISVEMRPEHPGKIYAYAEIPGSDERERRYDSLHLPGYMPIPVVSTGEEDDNINFSNPGIKIEIPYDGRATDEVIIRFDKAIYDIPPDPTAEAHACASAGAMEFCAEVQCLDWIDSLDANGDPIYVGGNPSSGIKQICNEWDDRICLTEGYNTAPIAMVDHQSVILQKAPNRKITKNTPFDNARQNREFDDGELIPPPLTTVEKYDIWIYDPPVCYALTSEGNCNNYSGQYTFSFNGGFDYINDYGTGTPFAINNTGTPTGNPLLDNVNTEDPYGLKRAMKYTTCGNSSDPGCITPCPNGDASACRDAPTEQLRDLNAKELGFCPRVPADMTTYYFDIDTQTYPYPYKVPRNCNEIEIKLWGGGGGGGQDLDSNANSDDVGNAGGGGAYVTATLSVDEGDIHELTVGKGGFIDKKGRTTSFKYGNKEIEAKGGKSSLEEDKVAKGGKFDCDGVNNCSGHNGSDGEVTDCPADVAGEYDVGAGGVPWDPDTGAYKNSEFKDMRQCDRSNTTGNFDNIAAYEDKHLYSSASDSDPTDDPDKLFKESNLLRPGFGEGGCASFFDCGQSWTTQANPAAPGGHGYAEIRCTSSKE